ncbi:MAG: ShlB/FhaC/HecB family hemolysin secretion/activation protein [Chthoniobacteraceae bacterium]
MIRNRLRFFFPPMQVCLIPLLAGLCGFAKGVEARDAKIPEQPVPPSAETQQKLFIREFRVLGTQTLPRIEVEEAVYPFLGPGRTFDDVEKARAALEKKYHDKGYKATQVVIPEQTGGGGLVLLQAYEGKVGSLRVKGAKYFLPSRIKQMARSMAEGKVLNFNDVQRDIVALNQGADRRVEPKLTPSGEPGVFDIDLNVKDTLPLHGRVELNNRRSANTTDLRLNTSLSYTNLWQLGHTIGGSMQLSPENQSEVKVFSGFYIWRMRDPDWLSVLVSYTKQDSNVSSLGGSTVLGKGEILGVRGIATLPGTENFFHSLSAGFDYKHFNQTLNTGTASDVTPIFYYPVSLSWDGTWIHKKDEKVRGTTEMSAGVTANLRGLGSSAANLDRNRFGSDGNFFYFRGEVAHTQKLRNDWEAFLKVHGQASDQPLVNSEQVAGGGMGTVRGYIEAEAVGDNGIFSTVELRTPSLLREVRRKGDAKNPDDRTGDEWRIYGFFDAGAITLHKALAQQTSSFQLASFGIGTELQLRKHFHAIAELALPLTGIGETSVHEARVNFRLWADF